jgi:hypothetical protein
MSAAEEASFCFNNRLRPPKPREKARMRQGRLSDLNFGKVIASEKGILYSTADVVILAVMLGKMTMTMMPRMVMASLMLTVIIIVTTTIM